MFTFVTITYNQEKYIIEHLESIKYQIENFYSGKKVNLIISDDCSQDNTVLFAKQWIEQHRDIFSEVETLISHKNQGIVKNYLRATNAVKTPAYKLLAGDDIYFKNNIFETVEELTNQEILFTPTIYFNEDKAWNPQEMGRLLTLKGPVQIRKDFKFHNPFNAPGTFYSTDLIQDEGLQGFVSQYTWTEDIPICYFLFNKKPTLNYGIKVKPYILYRCSVGISTNKKNEKNDVFHIELATMEKDFGMVLNKYPKYINPYRYYFKLSLLKHKYIDTKFNREVKNYNIIMNEEVEDAQKFLMIIKTRAEEFTKSFGIDV